MPTKEQDHAKKDRARFGGLRQLILERDSYRCRDCGMRQAEHLKKWGRSLTINHIDGNGRNSRNPNNDPNNLETLCLRCHGIKDGPRWLIAGQVLPTHTRLATSSAGPKNKSRSLTYGNKCRSGQYVHCR